MAEQCSGSVRVHPVMDPLFCDIEPPYHPFRPHHCVLVTPSGAEVEVEWRVVPITVEELRS